MITVVIAAHNENIHDIRQTVRSIVETSPAEVVVVDDASESPIGPMESAAVLRTGKRLGVGPARHMGVELCRSPWVVICDAHMIFKPGWYEPTLTALQGNQKLLLCGRCLALNEKAVDLRSPVGEYNGARMVIHDPGQNNVRWRILTAKWAENRDGDFYPISAVMGALYAMNRDFFLRIGGLKMLREFGGDEESLSIKTMLAGGEIRMFKQLCAGHKFRSGKPPYRVLIETCLYNTMMIAHTCCPPDVAKELIGFLGPGVEIMRAKDMVRQNRAPIEAERSRLLGVFKVGWPAYLSAISKIDLPTPSQQA